MTAVSATEARDAFGETLNRVAYGKERVVLSRRGKPLAALIPLEDLELLEELEDRLDVQSVREALTESGERLPYEEVRRELGLP
jgi:prevent-host-death family protein